MLNENDFSEIGKRMYGLEAEPPEKGWEKIAGGIKNGGKRNFFSRHWWKSLFLLIPVLLYLANEQGLLSTGSLSAGLKLNSENNMQLSDNSTTNLPPTAEISDSASMLEKSRSPLQSTLENTTEEKENQSTGSVIRDESATNTQANFTGTELTTDKSTPEGSSLKNGRNLAGSATLLPSPGRVEDTSNSESPLLKNGQSKGELPIAETSLYKNDIFESTALSGNGDINKNGLAADSTFTLSEEVNRLEVSAVPPVLPDAGKEETMPAPESSMDKSTEGGSQEDDEDENSTRPWRVTASFTPHFVRKSVLPVENDDVFITNLDRKKAFDRAGFGLAIGVGKQIRPNLFLDAQATFSSQREHFSWTYTTGAVDTLIATQDANGAVRVAPVYKSASAGIESKLNYAGVRIGGTYYFWSRPDRRFNVSAFAGINSLVHANVKENISGNWERVDQDDLAKTMYNFTFSAGYNFRLGQAWEVQVNPSITYYTGKESSYQQLRNLNQRSYGITLLLSRFF